MPESLPREGNTRFDTDIPEFPTRPTALLFLVSSDHA